MTSTVPCGAPGVAGRAGVRVEIACDESGFSGGSLTGEHNRVFAHASVELSRSVATELVDEVRHRVGASTGEGKASTLLRPRHRPVLLWLLGPAAPLARSARVHLSDTRFFVVARMVDVLLGGAAVSGIDCPGTRPGTRELAVTLYRRGPDAYGGVIWQDFLTLAGNLLRTNNRWAPRNPVDAYFATVASMISSTTPTAVNATLVQLLHTRAVAQAVRSDHLDHPRLAPLLEPLIPAMNRAVHVWAPAVGSLSVVHDEQSALTPERVATIATRLAGTGRRLTQVRQVDSRTDPRVQVADFVAGIARRVAADALAGLPDDELVELVRPLVDPHSVWVGAPTDRLGPGDR